MKRIRNLGLAMIALGLVELAWVAFCVFGGTVMAIAGFADDKTARLLWVAGAAYGALALGNLPIALLHLASGARLRQGRGFILAIAALAACLISSLFALYCAPFSLFVLVYGIIVLVDPESRKILDPAPSEAL